MTKLPQMAALFGVTTDYLLSDEPVEKNAEPAEAPEPPQNPPVYPEWVNNLPKHMMNMVKKFGWLYGLRVAVGGALMTAMGLLGRWMFKTMIFSGAGTSYGGWTTSGDVPQSILNELNRQSGFVTSGLDSFDPTAWNVLSGFTGFIIFLGIPAAFLYNILAAILRALGDSRTPVLFLALSSALNVGLDIATIKLLHMGVEGTALATVISQGVSGVICFFYMRSRFSVLHMSAEERRPDRALFKRLCYMGIPMGLQYSVTAIGSLIIQATMNGFGSIAVAGATAANRINGFLTCPIEALGASMAPYVGQNLGAGKLDRITKGVVDASVSGFVCAAVLYVVIWFFGEPLTGIFLDVPDPQVIDYAVRFLRLTGAGYCLLTLVNTVRFSIQGMGFSVLAILSGVMEMIARTVAGLVIAPHIGFAAVALGHPLAWLAADCFLIPAFLLCRRKVARVQHFES